MTTSEAGTRIAIVVPASAALVRIVSGDQSIWEKVDDGVTSDSPADSSGAYHLVIGG